MATAYLHNFILQTSQDEQNEMNREIQREQQDNINFDINEDEAAEDDNIDLHAAGSQNPRERRRRGAELLDVTLETFRHMRDLE